MGYNSTFTGEIRIDPPLKWAEFSGSEFLDKYGTVHLVVTEETVSTDDGTLMRRTATHLAPYGGQMKGYDLETRVKKAIALYGKSGHVFNGTIEVEGEDGGDLWRLEVVDNQVSKVRAFIVWPEEMAALRSAIRAIENERGLPVSAKALLSAASELERRWQAASRGDRG